MVRAIRILAALLTSVLLSVCAWAGTGWKAGVAKADITPEKPMWLAGYAARTHESSGTVHALWVKALALEAEQGARTVLVTSDILGFPKPLADAIVSDIGARYGLSRAQILLTSSHTHSGPVLSACLPDCYSMTPADWERSDEYSARLRGIVVGTVGQALERLAPASLLSGEGEAGFAVNRRNNREAEVASRLQERLDLKGPTDHSVPVLAVRAEAGNLVAVVFGYACHNTTLNDYQWNGDYAGFAQLALEQRHPGTLAMFWEGCGADQNPIPRRSLDLAQSYGGMLAGAVEKVVGRTMEPLPSTLASAFITCPLPFGKVPGREELKTYSGSDPIRTRWAARLLKQAERGEQFPDSYPYPVQVWRLGDITWIAMGGEVVVDYALRFKRQYGPKTWVAGYSNDVMAYIPSDRVWQEGGYEAASMTVYGLPAEGWAAGIEDRIATNVDRLVRQMTQTGSAASVSVSEAGPASGSKLIARTFNSGFAQAHDTYNGISAASDGKIYYVLSSELHDVGAQVYCYDPPSGLITHLGDLTEICGEKDAKAIVQGKSHVAFYESRDKLYFATHIGYYTIKDGMETTGVPPAGYKPYPGGHFVSFDLATRKFEKLATAPGGEGIISMTMDRPREVLYGLSWPTGVLLRYDLKTSKMTSLGPVSGRGESGRGAAYRTLCRSLVVDPRDGSLYLSNGDGDILRLRYGSDKIEPVQGVDLRKDYFGLYDPTSPGHMGYNWRQVVWHPVEQAIYGVHGNSGYLFRFDPSGERVDVLERLTSLPSKRSGMYDQFSYGYLGFALGPDKETLYYLTGGTIYENGKRVTGKTSTAKGESKGQENLHLVTYHIPTARYEDHGPIFFADGSHPYYVNSIAVGQDGTVYALSRITENGRTRTDLIAVRAQH